MSISISIIIHYNVKDQMFKSKAGVINITQKQDIFVHYKTQFRTKDTHKTEREEMKEHFT